MDDDLGCAGQMIRAEDIGQMELGLEADRQVGRHGSCGCEHHEGREAVMPESGLEIDLAECEDSFVLRGPWIWLRDL